MTTQEQQPCGQSLASLPTDTPRPVHCHTPETHLDAPRLPHSVQMNSCRQDAKLHSTKLNRRPEPCDHLFRQAHRTSIRRLMIESISRKVESQMRDVALTRESSRKTSTLRQQSALMPDSAWSTTTLTAISIRVRHRFHTQKGVHLCCCRCFLCAAVDTELHRNLWCCSRATVATEDLRRDTCARPPNE